MYEKIELEKITKEYFLSEIKRKTLNIKTKQTDSGGYYAYVEEFPNVVGYEGGNPNKEKAIEDLYEGLWESFEFLRENENRLGEKPKRDLEKFKELLV
ncbi:TPA: hypothetical protein DCX16_03295 [bacterium]|nr:hypothetical protein [bacterium]